MAFESCAYCHKLVDGACKTAEASQVCTHRAAKAGLSAVADALSAPAVAPSDNTTVLPPATPVAQQPALPLTEVQIGGDHYKTMAIQPLTYIQANEIGFEVGNIIKYVSRYKKKGGTQDLEKARDMLDKLIAFEVAKEKQGLMEYLRGLFQSV